MWRDMFTKFACSPRHVCLSNELGFCLFGVFIPPRRTLLFPSKLLFPQNFNKGSSRCQQSNFAPNIKDQPSQHLLSFILTCKHFYTLIVRKGRVKLLRPLNCLLGKSGHTTWKVCPLMSLRHEPPSLCQQGALASRGSDKIGRGVTSTTTLIFSDRRWLVAPWSRGTLVRCETLSQEPPKDRVDLPTKGGRGIQSLGGGRFFRWAIQRAEKDY